MENKQVKTSWVQEDGMAIIQDFLYCLNINTVDGRTDIVGLLSAMEPEYIPGLFSFSINFTILDLEEGEHFITVKFKNPDREIITSINDVKVEYKKDANSNLPKEYRGVNVAAGLQNVDFKKSGVYSTQIILDDVDMGEFEIFAKGKNEQ